MEFTQELLSDISHIRMPSAYYYHTPFRQIAYKDRHFILIRKILSLGRRPWSYSVTMFELEIGFGDRVAGLGICHGLGTWAWDDMWSGSLDLLIRRLIDDGYFNHEFPY